MNRDGPMVDFCRKSVVCAAEPSAYLRKCTIDKVVAIVTNGITVTKPDTMTTTTTAT